MKSAIRTMSTFAIAVVCLSVLAGAAQAQTVYLGTSGEDLDSAAAWSSGIPAGQTATINVAGANLPRWQTSMTSGTIINHTAGVLTFTTGPYNAYGASGVSDFTYNMSGGGMTGSGQEINVNTHTFNLSGGDISSTVQFRLLNSGVLNVSGSGTLDAPTIAGTVGTMNSVSGWTGSVTIDDLDEAGWKTMLATTLAGSTFDGADITTANFADNFVVSGNTLTLRTAYTWDDGAGDDYWSSGANWDGDPSSGPTDGKNVVLTATAQSRLDYAWTIQSGESLTTTSSGFGDELVLDGDAAPNGPGALTLATGGTMDIGFMRPRFNDGGDFTIEAGASLDTDNYGLNTTSADITFEANAAGVTLWNNSNQFEPGLDNLTVDLSSYILSNGRTIVLVDYDVAPNDEFASTNLTAGWWADLDYAYDQGGSDYAIALTNIRGTLTYGAGANTYWSTAGNWDHGVTPTNGDSVVVGVDRTFLDIDYTVESGRSLNHSNNRLEFVAGGSLTLATGGTFSMVNVRYRFDNNDFVFTIESDATLNTSGSFYGTTHTTGFNPSMNWIADADSVTTWNVTDSYTLPTGVDLTVDLSNYDPTNDTALVLVDYGGTLTGTFSSTNLTAGWSGGIDYDYNGEGKIALTGITHTLTWDDGDGASDNWSAGDNWDPNTAGGPVDGDNVVLTPTAQSVLDGSWTIQSGRSLTTTSSDFGDELVLQSGSALTLATGGTMDIGFMRPRWTSGGQFTIEPGASLNTDNYGLGSVAATITFEADASGVTLWNNSNQFQIDLDNLVVDLSSYDIANGTTLVLVDYDGALSDTFSTVSVLGGFTGTIDYAHDQGSGDLAIALTNIAQYGTLFKFR